MTASITLRRSQDFNREFKEAKKSLDSFAGNSLHFYAHPLQGVYYDSLFLGWLDLREKEDQQLTKELVGLVEANLEDLEISRR